MTRTRITHVLRVGLLAVVATSALVPSPGWGQTNKRVERSMKSLSAQGVDQPDAQRTKDELSSLLDRYPPSLRAVLATDPTLLENEAYLATYPALQTFLSTHPEIARNPAYYVGDPTNIRFNRNRQEPISQEAEISRQVIGGLGAFAGFGMAIGLLVWLIKTVVDYRRWSRLAKVQTDAHTKLLDRFTANEDLFNYIKSPAGAKFLESSPIMLEPAPRGMGAPMGRIMWSIQGGIVLFAGGTGLLLVSHWVANRPSPSVMALGILGIALGLGFVVSAIVSYVISRRLGLIEPSAPALRPDQPPVV